MKDKNEIKFYDRNDPALKTLKPGSKPDYNNPQTSYYDPNDPKLKTLKSKKALDSYRRQKILLRFALVFLFFLAEGLMMWAFADAKVAHSPVKQEVVVGVKPPKKEAKKDDTNLAAPSLNDTEMSLVIPKLYINAPVDPVGVTSNGEMATSESLKKVAWYKEGTKPGSKGSAVFAGHYGGPNEIGIFRTLDTIKQGDKVEVRFKSGKTQVYEVYNVAKYNIAGVPLQELFNKNDGTYLNLITCVGRWNSAINTYDERLVVYTKRVN